MMRTGKEIEEDRKMSEGQGEASAEIKMGPPIASRGSFQQGGGSSSASGMDTSEPNQHLRMEASAGPRTIRDLDGYERATKDRIEQSKRNREQQGQDREHQGADEKRVRVERDEGESRGVVTEDMELDKMSDDYWEETKQDHRYNRVPFLIIK